MKKVFLLFVSIVMIGFTSCSKDNDNDVNLPSPLGAWSFYSLNDEEVSDCERGTTLIFSSDNKFSLKTYSLDNGNDKKEKVCKLVAHISGTWHKNDIKYVFNYENGNTEETNILFSENGNKITTFHVVIEKENLEKGNTIGHRKILKKVWIRK